jgi:hypothetical protein
MDQSAFFNRAMAARSALARPVHLWPVICIVLLSIIPSLHAGFVETFDNGSNNGNWHLTVNAPTLETDGGNPGAYLRASADAAVPTWYVPLGTSGTVFLGDYAAKKVGSLAFDIEIFSGVEVPARAVTLDLDTTLGTGDFSKGVNAYVVGPDISNFPDGWRTYVFTVDASSPTIPRGWVVTRGDGQPGTDADWQALMHDIETIGVELGQPGFFYPFGIWDLGLDNPRITRLIH